MSPYTRIRRAITLTKMVLKFRRSINSGGYQIYKHDNGHGVLYTVHIGA